jgi:hypothetical protein
MNPEEPLADSGETPAAQTTPPQRNNGGIDESGNVDRIRHILFGSQMRDYDGRFKRLEDRLAKESAELRGDLQKRLDDLEGFIRGEVESLANRQRTETSERSQAFERMGRELAEAARNLESRIGQLDERTANDLRDLRQRLLDQSKALSAEIKDKHAQVQSSLDGEARQIRDAMTGRESLAEMFSEVALRLKGEFRVPGAS